MNYSETYFKLDSEEATVCIYCGSGFILFTYVHRAFDTSDMTNTLLKWYLMYWYYIHTTLQNSMQHAAWTFDTSNIPWILQNFLFCIPVFGGNNFLTFPIIDLTVEPNLICIIGQSDLDLCQQLSWMTQLLTLGTSFPVPQSVGS